MNRRAAITVLALSAAAAAQSPSTTASTVTYSWSWTESDFAGIPLPAPNGILEPGECALLRLDISFSNQNTTATYSPASPPPGSGTIRGFGWGFIDLHGSNNAAGSWNVDELHGLGTHSNWGPVSIHAGGFPANGGADLLSIQFGQFPLNAASIVTSNPISQIWMGTWTPVSYTPRTVGFSASTAAASVSGVASGVMFKIGSAAVDVSCPSDFGDTIPIPIVPSPAGAALLAAPLLTLSRRRSESTK